MKRLKQIFWLTFSEADEKYLDLVRIGYAFALLSAIILAGWSVFYNKQNFDMTDFGTGISLILFGGGAGIGMRAKLEDGTINE